jgi:Putative Flp pilus-assembly TadE/G-like
VRLGALGREEGSVTIWMLGLCVMVLFLGGISLDLWRAFAERRALAERVDSAAVAGGSGIDEAAFRANSTVQLDPSRAEALAWANLGEQPNDPSLVTQAVSASTATITVSATGQVHFTLLGVLLAGKPFMISVSATVQPEAGGP